MNVVETLIRKKFYKKYMYRMLVEFDTVQFMTKSLKLPVFKRVLNRSQLVTKLYYKSTVILYFDNIAEFMFANANVAGRLHDMDITVTLESPQTAEQLADISSNRQVEFVKRIPFNKYKYLVTVDANDLTKEFLEDIVTDIEDPNTVKLQGANGPWILEEAIKRASRQLNPYLTSYRWGHRFKLYLKSDAELFTYMFKYKCSNIVEFRVL